MRTQPDSNRILLKLILLTSVTLAAGCASSAQSVRYDRQAAALRRDDGNRGGAAPRLDAKLDRRSRLDRASLIEAVLSRNPSLDSARHAWREALARYPQRDSLEDPILSYSFAPLSIASGDVRFGSFIALGVEHIFTGYDHLMFLVGLLLLGGRFWSLLKIVSAFTIAHSVTLVLAALGIVELPPRMIEPAIALSIAYVGAENFILKSTDRRWIIAFVFGLVHGFGFAGILQEMGLPERGLVISLLSFNVGVEIGQIAVVALVLPLILTLQRWPLHRRVVHVLSAIIIGFGLYWFVERI